MAQLFQLRCFTSLKFVGVHSYTALLRCRYIISVRLKSELRLDHGNTLTLVFSSQSVCRFASELGITTVSCWRSYQTHDLTFDSRVLWCVEEYTTGGLNNCKELECCGTK